MGLRVGDGEPVGCVFVEGGYSSLSFVALSDRTRGISKYSPSVLLEYEYLLTKSSFASRVDLELSVADFQMSSHPRGLQG